jgi:hypothetical protein
LPPLESGANHNNIIAILCLQEFFKMATVSKSKKFNQSTLLQGQLDDNQTAINSRNRKSSRISSIGDKKADSNNNADSDNKANKKSRRQSDSGHSNDEDNDE